MPDTVEKSTHTRQTLSVPYGVSFKWAHKDFVEAQAIGAVFSYHRFRSNYIVSTLTHFLDAAIEWQVTVLGEPYSVFLIDLFRVVITAPVISITARMNHTLVEQALKWLRCRHQTAIVEHFMPEACIQKMQRCVLDAADVEVDRRPILLKRLIPWQPLVVWVDESQVVPRGTCPLRHHVCIALCWLTCTRQRGIYPISRALQRREGLMIT